VLVVFLKEIMMTRNANCTHAELQLRARAQEIVKNIADQFGGKLTPWHNSVAPEWEYAKLTIGEIGFTVGASTGGVVSVNGDPFTMGDRKLNVTPETMLASIQARMEWARQSPFFGQA
jgi:hypothetical protein